jgi:hypothetical protein
VRVGAKAERSRRILKVRQWTAIRDSAERVPDVGIVTKAKLYIDRGLKLQYSAKG